MRRPFSQARTLVCTTGIVTQLVFEHALRIRVKAEITFLPTLESRSEVTTPGSGSVVDIDIVSEGAGRSRQETLSEQSTSTETGTNVKRTGEAPRSDSGKDGNEECASSNLVGKMNNLVSTDLENLVSGRDILLLCLSSLLSPSPCSPLFVDVYFLHSYIFSASGRDVCLVLVSHPWLERIHRGGRDGRPLPNPRRRCR